MAGEELNKATLVDEAVCDGMMKSIPACFPLGATDELTQSLNKSGENARVHLFSVA